jgi:hypothetical protein
VSGPTLTLHITLLYPRPNVTALVSGIQRTSRVLDVRATIAFTPCVSAYAFITLKQTQVSLPKFALKRVLAMGACPSVNLPVSLTYQLFGSDQQRKVIHVFPLYSHQKTNSGHIGFILLSVVNRSCIKGNAIG